MRTTRPFATPRRGRPARRWCSALVTAALLVSMLPVAPAAAQSGDGSDSTAPSVVDVAITSDPGDDLTYGLDDEIEVSVTFSEAVTVDTAGGVPRLLIDFSTENWGHKWAGYESGSGTSVLTFTHTVAVPNYSSQGVAVPADSLETNGGSITSVASGTAAVLSYLERGHDPEHLVDADQAGGQQRHQRGGDIAQSTPTLPSGCGAASNGDNDLVGSVAASATVIRVTWDTDGTVGAQAAICDSAGTVRELTFRGHTHTRRQTSSKISPASV
ncbi:MAG: hypothetical protein OXI56_09390 [bacterium]|nr:hypothetical protein [bacterium]